MIKNPPKSKIRKTVYKSIKSKILRYKCKQRGIYAKNSRRVMLEKDRTVETLCPWVRTNMIVKSYNSKTSTDSVESGQNSY